MSSLLRPWLSLPVPLLAVLASGAGLLPAQAPASRPSLVPDLGALVTRPRSELAELVTRFGSDRSALGRRHPLASSPDRRRDERAFLSDWLAGLAALPFDGFGAQGRVDYVLLRMRIEQQLRDLDAEDKKLAEDQPLLPFHEALAGFVDARGRFERADPAQAAAVLAGVPGELTALRRRIEAGRKGNAADALTVAAPVARHASQVVERLTRAVDGWFRFHEGYDPVFTWWVRAPWRDAEKALQEYGTWLRNEIGGAKATGDDLVIDPIGRERLIDALRAAWIAYAPEDLVAMAERELAWCEAEMKQATKALGKGEDWQAALEHVKRQHVGPGDQPELIRDLAREAVAFITQRNLVTVPPLADHIWRMEMMTPERQRVTPFFTGGEVISVSFPTEGMAHDDKWMSLRGNNRYFSRATVFHELIPGHHLQGFMTARYQTHRQPFGTPFWTEGWALWWEMLLWDLGFPRTPEEKIGMLFWRMHRCARVKFSLGFHLGTMTPPQCVELLVDRVGHERRNAEAEVRRSFNGSYEPLYQLAYLTGGIQFRALHKELVGSGKMTARAFHDAVLESGNLPVEAVRVLLTGSKIERGHVAAWKFLE
jgi:uncharacterized protein (DUF885 family)